MVIKPSSASHLNLLQLQDEYRACAQAGAIISISGSLTPKDEESNKYWFRKTKHLQHHWFSTRSHANIVDLILRLEASGLGYIARVRREGDNTNL